MLRVARTIEAPGGRLWRLLSRPSLWPAWGPSVRSVDFDGDELTPRARGRVRTPLGLWLPFRVTAFEPGAYWAWSIGYVPATTHEVRSLGADRCRVTFGVPLLAAPYAAVCWVALRRLARLAEARPSVS